MDVLTHFQNQNGSVFTKLECQLACALFEYVRTRGHRRGRGDRVDHSQPPTLEMLNGIMREIRWMLWDSARRNGAPCNTMPPGAPLNAYCLVRHLRNSPSHVGWYNEVVTHPRRWSNRAKGRFEDWVYANSPLVQQYGFPIPRRLADKVMPAKFRSGYDRMVH